MLVFWVFRGPGDSKGLQVRVLGIGGLEGITCSQATIANYWAMFGHAGEAATTAHLFTMLVRRYLSSSFDHACKGATNANVWRCW